MSRARPYTPPEYFALNVGSFVLFAVAVVIFLTDLPDSLSSFPLGLGLGMALASLVMLGPLRKARAR